MIFTFPLQRVQLAHHLCNESKELTGLKMGEGGRAYRTFNLPELNMTVTLIAKVASTVWLNFVVEHLGLNCTKDVSIKYQLHEWPCFVFMMLHGVAH